jgi:transcriptional regulator with XRE-family HTH domain
METTFGQRLKEWREAAGISQAELARRIEASATWVSNLERDFSPTAKGGKPQPSVETCDRIAHALGVKIAHVRIAAGYAPPGKPETWLTKEKEIDEHAREREAEAARRAQMIKGFDQLSPQKQAQILGILKILQSDHPELLNNAPIEIISADDLRESDAEIDDPPPRIHPK